MVKEHVLTDVIIRHKALATQVKELTTELDHCKALIRNWLTAEGVAALELPVGTISVTHSTTVTYDKTRLEALAEAGLLEQSIIDQAKRITESDRLYVK